MKSKSDQQEFAKVVQYGLFAVAGVSIVCAPLQAFFPDRLNEKTALFLAVAVVALVVHQITKFKGFGIEFEKKVNELTEDVKIVEAAVADLEKDVGPGSKTSMARMAPGAALAAAPPDVLPVDPDDPNKGQFRGMPEANGRRLSATITPAAGPNSSRCRVKIKVVSIDPSRPLSGKVILHLHPTFGQWSSYELDVRGGVAEDEIFSYGAFTIGAVADGGETRLELDLMNVENGTKRFYEA